MPYTRPVSFFITLSPDLWHSCLRSPLRSGKSPLRNGEPALRSGKLDFLNGEPALRIDEPALGSGKSALRIGHPPTTTKPLHDDYQFRRHNDRKSSNMTNASSSRRRKRPSMMTGPIAAASRQSLRLPQAHLETSSRPPLSMAVRSPSRHPRALHHNDPTRPTMTDSATPPSSVTYESGTKSGTDAAQT